MTSKYTEGIILNVDYGFGMKFNDKNNLYLKLEIQGFDGYSCIQLFREEKIGELLSQYKSENFDISSVQSLVHRRIYLSNKKEYGTPSAVSQDSLNWISNDNWD